MDLTYPPELVTKVVAGVAADSTIRGSHIYSKESEIDDAESEKSSRAFSDHSPGGTTFYKVRHKALSPAHFPGNSDLGTVTVRYTVEAVSPQRSRLKIDAVFVRDSPREAFFSDGSVESAEYAEIAAQLKGFDAGGRPKPRAVSPAAAKQDTAGLQMTLQQEQERLSEAKATEAKLQDRLKKLEFDTMGKIKSIGVPLKILPYDHSSTILTLEEGSTVTVLTTTKYWYRVRTEKGEEGWIYYVFVEPLS